MVTQPTDEDDKVGKSCLYVKRLADVDEDVLAQLITRSLDHLRQTEQATAGVPRLSDMPAPQDSPEESRSR
ncbi:hypothetical protein ACPCG0_09500 [Propionibacteriaceae bacterium Y1923]